MKKVTLTNSFHNTKVVVLTDNNSFADAWAEIQIAAASEQSYGPARRKLARIRNVLCGSHDCCCGIVR